MARRRGDRLLSGKRDRLVTIQQLTDSTDPDSGEPIETWTTLVANFPVSKADVSGDETFKADQQSAKFDSEWEGNWRNDMDPDVYDIPKVRRLLFGQRVHDIVHCEEVGRRAGIVLQTLAGSKVPS